MNETTTLEPLEDDFCDVLGKAARGHNIAAHALAQATARPRAEADAWLNGSAVPDDRSIEILSELLRLRPQQLRASAHKAWNPHTPLPPNVLRYLQHPQVSNGYVFVTPAGDCAVIDPAGSAVEKLRSAGIAAERIRYILVTHRHADHCDALDAVRAYAPSAAVYMHPLERAAAKITGDVEPVANGAEYLFGDSVIRAFVVPGHTDGATVFVYDGNICVGDLFFAGSVGRTFGPHTSYEMHLTNIREHIFSMNPDMVVLPGHGPPTTIALEIKNNPFF